MTINRRQFLRESGRGLLVASIAGPAIVLSPAEARARQLPLKVLDEASRITLEAAADILLPGAAEAGVAYFIDEQLSRPANDALLIARYLQVPPPYTPFYQGAAQALDGLSMGRYDKTFAGAELGQQEKMIADLFPQQPEDWRGPPSQPVYLCLRSDAVDVVYGTGEGLDKLDIPPLAHIVPPENW